MELSCHQMHSAYIFYTLFTDNSYKYCCDANFVELQKRFSRQYGYQIFRSLLWCHTHLNLWHHLPVSATLRLLDKKNSLASVTISANIFNASKICANRKHVADRFLVFQSKSFFCLYKILNLL